MGHGEVDQASGLPVHIDPTLPEGEAYIVCGESPEGLREGAPLLYCSHMTVQIVRFDTLEESWFRAECLRCRQCGAPSTSRSGALNGWEEAVSLGGETKNG